jgi:hypothetical protein
LILVGVYQVRQIAGVKTTEACALSRYYHRTDPNPSLFYHGRDEDTIASDGICIFGQEELAVVPV